MQGNTVRRNFHSSFRTLGSIPCSQRIQTSSVSPSAGCAFISFLDAGKTNEQTNKKETSKRARADMQEHGTTQRHKTSTHQWLPILSQFGKKERKANGKGRKARKEKEERNEKERKAKQRERKIEMDSPGRRRSCGRGTRAGCGRARRRAQPSWPR